MVGPSRENACWILAGFGSGLLLGAYLASPRGGALGDGWSGPILLAGGWLSVLGSAIARRGQEPTAPTTTDS